ncbi:hypothetical protein ACQB60_24290 [Actinomycetota bacterium Odt1-20B]
MFGLIVLLGATVLGAGLLFGFHAGVLGLVLLVGGIMGLNAYTGLGTRRLPGERETVVEERHYIGGGRDRDEHGRHRW